MSVSHLATLISTALHSHCSAELAHFPGEFNRSLSLSVLFFFLPNTTHILFFTTLFITEFTFFCPCLCYSISNPPQCLALNPSFSGSITLSFFLLALCTSLCLIFFSMSLPNLSRAFFPTLSASFPPILPKRVEYWPKHTESFEWFLSCCNGSAGLGPLSRKLQGKTWFPKGLSHQPSQCCIHEKMLQGLNGRSRGLSGLHTQRGQSKCSDQIDVGGGLEALW